MKKISLVIVFAIIFIAPFRGRTYAACQSDDNNYGAVTLSVPTLPTTGGYSIWTRLEASNNNSSLYRLVVNGNTCYEVSSSINPGQWTWVSSQEGDSNRKVSYDFEKVSGNSLKLIGTNVGVKIDRVLLVKADCLPVDLGVNCENTNTSTAISVGGASEVPPPTAGEVSGLIVVSPTVSQDPEQVSKVTYFADSTVVPTAAGFALDTTLLSNGPHRITMQITMTNGTLINEATTLKVANKQNAFSPIMRWIRLNQHTAVQISTLIGGLLVGISVLLAMRHFSLKKRLLEFHGF